MSERDVKKLQKKIDGLQQQLSQTSAGTFAWAVHTRCDALEELATKKLSRARPGDREAVLKCIRKAIAKAMADIRACKSGKPTSAGAGPGCPSGFEKIDGFCVPREN